MVTRRLRDEVKGKQLDTWHGTLQATWKTPLGIGGHTDQRAECGPCRQDRSEVPESIIDGGNSASVPRVRDFGNEKGARSVRDIATESHEKSAREVHPLRTAGRCQCLQKGAEKDK